jgi:hypothetical protein
MRRAAIRPSAGGPGTWRRRRARVYFSLAQATYAVPALAVAVRAGT